jgi:cardiolipin synthase
MAYFIPVGKVLRALFRAPKRGVDVRIVVPGESDVKLVQWATEHLFEKCLRFGLQIFERQRRMLHSKVMVVDDEWTVVGSANMDPRSFRINYELLAVIRSRTFAAAITAICDEEICHSEAVTSAKLDQRTRWQKWRSRLAYSLRWWL